MDIDPGFIICFIFGAFIAGFFLGGTVASALANSPSQRLIDSFQKDRTP